MRGMSALLLPVGAALTLGCAALAVRIVMESTGFQSHPATLGSTPWVFVLASSLCWLPATLALTTIPADGRLGAVRLIVVLTSFLTVTSLKDVRTSHMVSDTLRHLIEGVAASAGLTGVVSVTSHLANHRRQTRA